MGVSSWAGGVLRLPLIVLVLAAGTTASIAQVRRLATYTPSAAGEAVRLTEVDLPAGIFLLDENYKFGQAAGNASVTWNRVYVIDGQHLREFKRNDFARGPLRSYDAGSPLLDVVAGTVPGRMVLLTRSALQLVDLGATPSPKVLSSVPVSNLQPVWGKLLARFGDTLYVADNLLRGFRVIDISNSSAPAEVTRYTSTAKVVGKPSGLTVTDLRREGSVFSLVVGGNLELVAVDNLIAPSQLTSLGSARFPGVTRGLLQGGYAFLADGPTVRIVSAAPGTPTFLTELLRFTTGADVTDLFSYKGRLYLLCGNFGYEVWETPPYIPR